MRDKFIESIKENQSAFGLTLADDAIDRLADHYEVVMQHNALLHLVGPCSASEFATRHILESLVLLRYLPAKPRIADVGAGAGLPSIPCMLVNGEISAVLIESKKRKAEYLVHALTQLGLQDRAAVIDRAFQECDPGNANVVTCRALDRFAERLPKVIKWAGKRKLVFFAGENIREGLEKLKLRYTADLLPLSDRRFIFAIESRR